MNWNPITTAPKDGRYILLAAPSGYRFSPLRVEVCHYDPDYRIYPWRNHGNDAFEDGGQEPTGWLPLPGEESDPSPQHAAITNLLADLDDIGFADKDSPVSSGDCVEVICQHIDNLRKVVKG